MKVAMLGHKVVPSRRGGIENVLTSLCPLFVENGIEVTCYNRMGDKVENEYVAMVENNQYRGVKLKTAWTLPARGIAAMLASFTAAIRAAFGKYDIVHFHAEGPCAAMWIPKLFGKKCVATVHGLDWQRGKWGGFASLYIRFGERVMVKYADRIIVLSESARAYFKETYNRDTVLIHNGIDAPERKAADLIYKQYGLEKDGYICIVSRLTEEKGIHYLIDAYNRLHTDKKLVIAGDTSDTNDYVARIKAMAEGNENILFTGFISGDVLRELYSNAYVVTVPSDLEGMSISLLEALAYGNAVVCSDIPENTAVTEDKALHFKKSDTEDLKEKLQQLCDDPSMVDALRAQAAAYILAKYNWQDIAKKTAALYKEI